MIYLRKTKIGCKKIIKFLIVAGTDINQLDIWNRNGLCYIFNKDSVEVAEIVPQLETAEILIEAGCDVQN